MGLDIYLRTDNDDYLPVEPHDDLFRLHSLSRTFCNFMSQDGGNKTAELWQIGKLTGVDVVPLDDMQNYADESWVESELEWAENEAGKQQILQEAKASQAKLKGNLDKVLVTVEALLSTLAPIKNLPDLLTMTDKRDVLNRSVYFADFLLDRGEGYIGNNFGQDLRNFKRFLEFAKSHGSTTVYFDFG